MRVRLLLVGLLVGLIALLPAAVSHAAVPSAGTVSQATASSSWTGGPFLTSNPSGLCFAVDPSCDTYSLTIVPPATGNYTVEITTTPSSEGDDYDLFVNGPTGERVGSSTSPGGHEKVVLTNPPAGHLQRQHAGLARHARRHVHRQGNAGRRLLLRRPPTPAASSSSTTRAAAQATVEVPLRVVAVGFAPGELDEAKVLGEIPNFQRPGVLIPRGQDSSGDQFPLFGAETLVNHGRNYYNDTKPFTVPYEYTWKPKLIYAPAAFTQGLFNAMKANSTTGDFAKSGEPPVPRGLQRDPRRLPRHRRARRAERARPLHRRREDRGLDRGQLEGAPRLGRPCPRQGPGPQPRLHGLHPEHVGLGRGPRDPEAAERVPRLEGQPDRPGHGRVRRDRLGPRTGAAATAS